jgi:Nuclease-related domain
VHTDEHAWRLGAIGEELVGAQLSRLVAKDPRWRVLHSIPVGTEGTDIDHLVIGPGGVFTLNCKHHPDARIWARGDTLMVNGQRHPYVHASRHEAGRASRALTAACGFPIDVTPVVVPVNADDITVKKSPADVHVVNRRRLRRWLRRRPEVLDDRAITAVYPAARWGSTWR